MESTRSHIEIDTELCIGAGQCALNAPEVFTQDDDGYSQILPDADPDAHEQSVDDALRACPVQALTLKRG